MTPHTPSVSQHPNAISDRFFLCSAVGDWPRSMSWTWTVVGERIGLVTLMDYDLGDFDNETCRLEPLANPFTRRQERRDPIDD
jgi:hypothetical protein